jgi:phosphoribosylformylglycinamidine cyclo-ligase
MTTYREAGVNIEAGDETVRRIGPMVRETFTPGVLADIGAFGSFFELDLGEYERPVLVSSIDGVGTKLKVAVRTDRHDTVGQDLVNHCVNDIAVCGAEPLYFLDYFATGTLEPDVAEKVVSGFVQACKANGCALVGGETAEMPDIYADGEYDLAGTIVGIVEKDAILDGSAVESGDVLLGLPSNGVHTNGFTLARTVLFDAFDVDDAPDELGGATVGEELLRIHRSYLADIQALVKAHLVHGLVHVTGGGIPDNTRRVVPDGLTFDVDYSAWDRPAIFDLIQSRGNVPEDDMRRTFNLGIGLIAIVPEDRVDAAEQLLAEHEIEPVPIGRIRS